MISKAKKIAKESIKAVLNPKEFRTKLSIFRKRRACENFRKNNYLEWFEKNRLKENDIKQQIVDSKKFNKKPLISIILPTYNTNSKYLAECIDSVIAQSYPNWELCVSDDASTNRETLGVLKKYSKKYKNIKVTLNKTNQHIAGSSNVALAMAKGEYVSLLDHDDILMPNALYETVETINNHPEADLIYTDEDKLENDKDHVEPFFKPDWSPDFLKSCNYITHFSTIRTSVMNEVGGFRIGTHGAQDWDLFLRITSKTDKIFHIPKILYTWRKSITSTAMSSDSKPYAYINQKKVLRYDLRENSLSASVHQHPSLGFWRVKYNIQGNPLVSIIIPTKNNYEYIKRCIDSIVEKSSYPNFEIMIVDTGSDDKEVICYYDKLKQSLDNIKIEKWTKKFNFSSVCNFGAKKSKGDYLLFLNNDTEVITPDWIESLLEHAQRKDIGMVGAKLLFANHTIQHAGVVLSHKDIAFHPFYGQNPLIDIFTYIYNSNIRNVSAVTGACCMTSRSKFNEVGGFDDKLRVTYNDVDLCLKLLDKGYRNLYTPFAELFHYESISVGKINSSDRDKIEYEQAKQAMLYKWGRYLSNDSYYNKSFEQFGPGYRL